MPARHYWNDIAPVRAAAEEAHRQKEYRPTVMALIRDEEGRVLFLQSAHDPDEWMLLQGGIDPPPPDAPDEPDEYESPLEALGREIGEEIEVGPEYIAPSDYIGCVDLDAEPGRVDKRGFTKGKRYFIFEVAYRGFGNLVTLVLKRDEISGYAWCRPDEIAARLAANRPEKRELILDACRKAGIRV